jgi:hypothetical protein
VEAENSKLELEAVTEAAKHYAERSAHAETSDRQMVIYLDRIASDSESSKCREASAFDEVALAQSRFEELCRTGQSLEEQLNTHKRYIDSTHQAVIIMRTEYASIKTYADDSQVVLHKTCQEKEEIRMQHECASPKLHDAARHIHHRMVASRGDKSAITDLHRKIGILEGQLVQLSSKPSEAHVAEAIANVTSHRKMDIETWKQALCECSAGVQERLTTPRGSSVITRRRIGYRCHA